MIRPNLNLPSLKNINEKNRDSCRPPQTTLSIPGVCSKEEFSKEDLEYRGEIGRGKFGVVHRVYHSKYKYPIAVKIIRSNFNETERENSLKDLQVIMKSNFPGIVTFYGAIFVENDCWICMELMDTSLDLFYKLVYKELNCNIPENILGKITVAVVSALSYLKCEMTVMHRDIKPSNILINRSGEIKLCDFGIAGDLVNSIAKTKDIGCKPYMAPERISPEDSLEGYDVRSDVWSLGISLYELATGEFPYNDEAMQSPFHQLSAVLDSPAPSLPSTGDFSANMRDFITKCLEKKLRRRPKYDALMKLPWYIESIAADVDVGGFFSRMLGPLTDSVHT